jgi:dihydroorotate dehydrogenase
VAVGTSNFIEPDSAVKIIEGIRQYCQRNQVGAVRDLIGAVEQQNK